AGPQVRRFWCRQGHGVLRQRVSRTRRHSLLSWRAVPSVGRSRARFKEGNTPMAKTIRRASDEYSNAGQPSDELVHIAQLMQQQANGGKKSRKNPQHKTWLDKKKEEAAKAAKAKAKKQGQAVWASTRSEARSSWHRNRAQLAPWMLSTPFYAAGEAALLASQQPTATAAAA